MDILEIKIRFVNDLREWQNIPLHFETGLLNENDRRSLLRKFKDFSESEFIKCIRWNVKGSLQGNYFNNRNSTSWEFNDQN